jgi:cysteine-rich repeat protein
MRTGWTIRLALATGCTLALHGVAAAVLCSTLTAPPGVVYLYDDAATSTVFSGNSFQIDGRDTTLAGDLGTEPAVYGVAARNDANAQEVRDALNGPQLDNVIGRGFEPAPPVPSIGVVAGPDAAGIAQLVNVLLAKTHVVLTDAVIAGNATWGTPDAPSITHLVGQGAGVTMTGTANIAGAGVLVVDGALTVQGAFAYDGLVIVRGPLSVVKDFSVPVVGNVSIDGSVWTTNLHLAVGGSLWMRYSREAIALALDAGASGGCQVAVCGDGIRTEDEGCDDGNALDGDCCSSTCLAAAASTPCADDGNVCTSDVCNGAGACVHGVLTGACDDDDACTSGDTCVAGSCTGTPVDCGACMRCDVTAGCIADQQLDCREPLVPSLSRLGLTDSDDPRRDRLSWRWRSADGLAFADLGDPTASTGYSLCLFGGPSAGSVLLRAAVAAGTDCGASCGWTATSRGFRYRDPLARTGVKRIDLSARLPGVGSIRVAGMGEHLHVPELPFPIAAPLVLQLRAAGGACWQTTYPIGNIGGGHGVVARGAQP